MNLGSFIDICLDEDNPLIRYKGDVVPGIQEFVCDLTAVSRKLHCKMMPLKSDEGEVQRAFASELVKRGFNVAWWRLDEERELSVPRPSPLPLPYTPVVPNKINDSGVEITWGDGTAGPWTDWQYSF